MNFRNKWIFVVIILLITAAAMPAVVIKIGSIVPARSAWDRALTDLTKEWEKISNGEIQVKIYPGGIVGTEPNMLTSMRLGTLNGAVFTNIGLTLIVKDAFVLNAPFLMDTDAEFNYVFDHLKPALEKQFAAKGYKVMIWLLVGWDYFFSKEKVLYPEEMKKQKLSFTAVDPELVHSWKTMGYDIIPNDLKDLLMALQSGMVNAYFLPPLLAGMGQFFALTPHMLNLRLTPIIGGMVLTMKAWNSIPAKYHEPMFQAIARRSAGLYQQTQELEKEAIRVMKANGLIIHDVPADAPEKWRRSAALGMGELVDKAFSREIYEEAKALIREFKQKNGQ